MWASALTGLGVAALHPDDEHRRERAFLAAGVGYNAGLAGGLLARGFSPSVARVRLVDLLGLAGGLATSGSYLAVADDADTRLTEGIAVLGAGAGLAIGWLVTSGMPDEVKRPTSSAAVTPAIAPVPGGATLGLGGLL